MNLLLHWKIETRLPARTSKSPTEVFPNFSISRMMKPTGTLLFKQGRRTPASPSKSMPQKVPCAALLTALSGWRGRPTLSYKALTSCMISSQGLQRWLTCCGELCKGCEKTSLWCSSDFLRFSTKTKSSIISPATKGFLEGLPFSVMKSLRESLGDLSRQLRWAVWP